MRKRRFVTFKLQSYYFFLVTLVIINRKNTYLYIRTPAGASKVAFLVTT